jgi:hypothetical protein
MKRRRLTTATVAAISIPALGLGVGAITSAAQASPRAPSARAAAAARFSEQTVAVDCQGSPQVRPGRFTLACADGYDYLARLSWTRWAPGLASATGVQEENGCVPYCAAGHFHAYPVAVTFRGTAPVHGAPGRLRYTDVTLRYLGARPDVDGHQAPAAVTMPLPAWPS